MNGIPDSAEAVALELLRIIEDAAEKAGRRDRHGNKVPERARLLDLYTECLAGPRQARPRGDWGMLQ